MSQTNIIIIAVIIVVVIGGGVYLWLSPKTTTTQPTTQVSPTSQQTQEEQTIEQPSGEQQEQIDAYAGWKTYTNEEYGFSFRYPNSWYAFENDNLTEKMCQAELKVEGDNNFPNNDCIGKDEIMYISTINGYCTKGGCVGTDLKRISNSGIPKGFWISKISSAEAANIKSDLSNSQKVATVEKKEITQNGVVLSYFNAVTVDGGWEWEVFWTKNNVNFWARGGSEGGEDVAEKQIFDQILSTFKFTK